MNKKLKIVSTLGLAGIMSLGTLASTTLATNITSRGRHQILGHYASLDGIEDAVPVVLDNSANKNY